MDDLNNVKRELDDKLKTLNKISVRVEELKAQSKDWEDENVRIEDKMKQATVKEADADKMIAESQARINEIQARQKAEDMKFVELRNQADAEMNRLTSLSAEVGDTSNKLKDTKQSLSELEASISKKTLEIQERMKIVEANEATLKDVEEELGRQRVLLEKREKMLVFKEKAK